MPDKHETLGQELSDARGKIEQTRKTLQAALQNAEVPDFRQAVARLGRVEAELVRIEEHLPRNFDPPLNLGQLPIMKTDPQPGVLIGDDQI